MTNLNLLLIIIPWDNQCATGLKCFQRDGGEPVPGCEVGEQVNVGTDYCIPDDSDKVEVADTTEIVNAAAATVEKANAAPENSHPGFLSLCQGKQK